MFDTTGPKDIYLDDATYHRLKGALVRIDRDGICPETDIIAALGEIGGIWPESVLDEIVPAQTVAIS